jgi:hypothetical protein
MDVLDIKLQKEVALLPAARVALEKRITTAKESGAFVLPVIVCVRWPTGKWTLLVSDRKILALDRLILKCPDDSIKSKHVDFGDVLCDMFYNQKAYRYVLGYVHHLMCEKREVFKVQRIQARLEWEDFSSSSEEEEEEDAAEKTPDADNTTQKEEEKKKKESSWWWSSWFRRPKKKYTGDVLVYKIIADFFNTIVQKDRIHPSTSHDTHFTFVKHRHHPSNVTTTGQHTPLQRLAPNSKSEAEDDDSTDMSFLRGTTRSRTSSTSSARVSKSTPLPGMKSIPEESLAVSPRKPDTSSSSLTMQTSTADARVDEIVLVDDDGDSFSSSSSSEEAKPPPKLKAPPRSTLSIRKHTGDDLSGSSESSIVKSEPLPKKVQHHQRSKSLSGSDSHASASTFIALPKKGRK